jgi:hypothetical protein
MAATKPFEITGLRLQNTHCRNFVFKNPTVPSDWGDFCKDHDVSCTHDEIRAFVRARFDCMLCREKLENALYPFSDPIPTVACKHDSEDVSAAPDDGGVVNLQVSFDRHVDPVWTPLAVDHGASVRLGFDECERLVHSGLALDTSDPTVLEEQNRWIMTLVTTLVRTIHAVHRMQAVAVFDTASSCTVMTHIIKNTDLLLSLLHTQLGRVRTELAKALGEASFEQCPVLTDVNTPYFAKWDSANPTLSTAIRRILVDNNRKRLLHFRGWVSTTRLCLAMPRFAALATAAMSKWRFVDSEDFTIAQAEISDKSVYITAFELVLGCLAREPPPGCPLDVPTVHMDATMLDSRVNTAYTTCIAGYKRILVTNQAQMVPSCFQMTATMKTEIETHVRRMCARFYAYESDFNGVIASMPGTDKSVYTRAKLRFLHAHSIVNQGVILRRLACFAKYLHDIAPILRGAECGETGRCMPMVMAAVQYNKVEGAFSDFVVSRLIEGESETEARPSASKKTKKKSKQLQKKKESDEMRAVAPPELKWAEVVTARLPPLPPRAQPLSQSSFSTHTPIVTATVEDDGQGEWEKESSGKRRKDPARQQQMPQRIRRNGRTVVPYVPPAPPAPPAPAAPVETPAPPAPPAPAAPVETPAPPAPVETPSEPSSNPAPAPAAPVETPSNPAPAPPAPVETPSETPSNPAPVPPAPAAPVETPSEPPSNQRRRRRARGGGGVAQRAAAASETVYVQPPSTIQYLPQYIGIPGYDPSTYYMHNVLPTPPPSNPVPIAMYSPSGTVLYGHFLPQQLVYMPMIHF